MLQFNCILKGKYENISEKQLTVVYEGEERFLYKKLRVEHHQLGGCWNQVVALVEFEEFHEYLGLIFLWNTKNKSLLTLTRLWFYQVLNSLKQNRKALDKRLALSAAKTNQSKLKIILIIYLSTKVFFQC